MTKDQFYNLLDKYTEGKCSEAEKSIVEDWYLKFNEDENRKPLPESFLLEVQDRLRNNLLDRKPKRHYLLNYRYLAAASVLLLIISIGVIIYKIGGDSGNKTAQKAIIVPGSDRARLTLADGKTMDLVPANTQISQMDNKVIGELKNGEIRLATVDNEQPDPAYLKLNSLDVPRGGKWKMVLADGTKVWLNAATSFRFPTAFTGHSREVFLDGEAYFEVAKDKAHPFIVHSGTQRVQVLGTHFNINSYRDEIGIKTTLLEGSVKINGNNLLKPGQKGTFNNGRVRVVEVDTEEDVAWKNDEFIFNSAPLSAIMRQIGRWYNVDIHFQSSDLSEVTFSGSAPRSVPISTLLKRLSLTREVDFATEGKKIIVKPYKKIIN